MYVLGDRVGLESSRVSVAGNVDEQAYTRTSTSTRMHRGKTHSLRRAHTKIKPYLFFFFSLFFSASAPVGFWQWRVGVVGFGPDGGIGMGK